MVLKSYPDGSEFTEKHLAGVVAGGLVIGTAIYITKEKISTWRTKRWMKKTGWPQKTIDQM